MYVKICGLQTAASVDAAVHAGADAVGFVFAPGSPRTISAQLASELGRLVPDGIETVGVFRNQPMSEVLDLARKSGVTTVQLHGSETLTDLASIHTAGLKTLRAFSAQAYKGLQPAEKAAWDEERILLDAVEPGAGIEFDPQLLAEGRPTGFWLLAGGLNPSNVASLISTLHPAGVDVSSGVESSRGIKSIALIEAFIRAARLPH